MELFLNQMQYTLSKPTLLYQPQNGYCYNSDTIFLYDFLLKCNIPSKVKVLEVGSGCGILGILLSRDLDIYLTQIELQEIFFNLSSINARVNGIETNIINDNFLSLNIDEKFDYIVSNPPFYDSGVLKSTNEHLNICKINTYLPMESFFKKVYSTLVDKGRFVFCYNASLIQEVIHCLHISCFKVEKIKFVFPKKDKFASLVLIYCRKNSKSVAKVEPCMRVFDMDDFNEDVKVIYKNANTYTIKCPV